MCLERRQPSDWMKKVRRRDKRVTDGSLCVLREGVPEFNFLNFSHSFSMVVLVTTDVIYFCPLAGNWRRCFPVSPLSFLRGNGEQGDPVLIDRQRSIASGAERQVQVNYLLLTLSSSFVNKSQ